MIRILSEEKGQLMVAFHKSPLFGQEECIKLPKYQCPYQANQVKDRHSFFKGVSSSCHPSSNGKLLGCLAMIREAVDNATEQLDLFQQQFSHD